MPSPVPMIRQHYWLLGSKEEGQEGKDHEQKKEERKNEAIGHRGM